MGIRLRGGARLTALVVLSVLPVVSGSENEPLVDARPRASAASADGRGPVIVGHREARLAPTAPPQDVEPQTTLVARADRHRKVRLGARGQVFTVSSLTSHDLPSAALAAYKSAAASRARTHPGCQLPWTLLAGIGRVESDHGRYGGSVLSTDGVSRPAIIGVALNGRGPVAAIRDTDDGRLDRDKVWDRAVGPMQFIPSTWAYSGRDGDGDGRKNPHDLDDAALAAATYLCSGSGSMLVDASAKAAIFRYNPSDYYVALVQAFERGYRTGVFVLPSPPAPEEEVKKKRKRRDRDRAGTTAAKPEASTAAPKPKPSSTKPSATPKPSPKPSPSPSPTPTPPATPTLVTLSGSLAGCDGGWCIGSTRLDLGPDAQLGATAAKDYDGDGSVESNSEELAGLEGTQVELRVGKGTTPAKVYVVNGHDYRYADGTFA